MYLCHFLGDINSWDSFRKATSLAVRSRPRIVLSTCRNTGGTESLCRKKQNHINFLPSQDRKQKGLSYRRSLRLTRQGCILTASCPTGGAEEAAMPGCIEPAVSMLLSQDECGDDRHRQTGWWQKSLHL